MRAEAIQTVVNKLGGNAKVAAALGVHPSAVTQWKRRNSIPAKRIVALLILAKDSGIHLEPGHFFTADSFADNKSG